jgi:ABC-type transport system involved in multi-copper enzyme maturation permease subunit
VRGTWVVFGYALRESLRRRVFHAGVVLTALFLGLYGLGCSLVNISRHRMGPAGELVQLNVLAAATIFGLAVFATYFFGVALAIFLTISAARGDAELGILQAIVVRPLARWQFLLGRLAAAITVAVCYVAIAFTAAVVITDRTLGWTPRQHALVTGLEICAALAVVATVSMFGSVFLSGIANGIGTFMLFGAGLFGGLLGEVGQAIGSHKLETIADVVRVVTPFEWLCQDSLGRLVKGESSITDAVLRLGPFGGSVDPGTAVWLWAGAYVLIVAGAAAFAFSQRDL